MTRNQANTQFQGKLSMKVIRKDGTLENHETEWSALDEEHKKHMLSLPSFKGWLKGKQNNKED